MSEALPPWTLVPFGSLVVLMATLPWVLPHFWEKPAFQALVVSACALPVVAFLLATGRAHELGHGVTSYATFIVTLGALYVTAGGIFADTDLRGAPRTNVALLLTGSALASVIGTTGASVLMIRPLLRANRGRERVSHLVPFFILAVANAGGMLTPLGDPPLLVGFIAGVPFFWTLQLWPIWLLYNLGFAGALYVIDSRASALEPPDRAHLKNEASRRFALRGKRNLPLLLAIPAAALLPAPWRELLLAGIGLASLLLTPRAVRECNDFSLAPLTEVAVVFVGLFVCLVPVELTLGSLAHELPFQHGYQLFWGSGLLSAALDNAPTYAAFFALAKSLSEGGAQLVAGVAPLKLAAISAGCVAMGATTYLGNGPNLMVKAIAERAGIVMPSFFRYAAFAFLMMLPAHLVVTAALIALER